MVKCDKHSRQVFFDTRRLFIQGQSSAQTERLTVLATAQMTRVALVKASKNKANPATDQKVAITEQSQFKD